MNDEMKQWLALQPASVRNQVAVLSKEEAGPMYHISKDGGIKRFTPMVSRRTASTENISVPRVCVAGTLVGCMIGYAATLDDFLWRRDGYKGGWYIYDIDYQYLLKPSVKLLYDVEHSQERWLVTYSKDTVFYRPTIAGHFFYTSAQVKPNGRGGHEWSVEMVVNIQTDTTVLFDLKRALTKGTWRIKGLEAESSSLTETSKYIVEKISDGEYARLKKQSADLLSLGQNWFFW